MCTKKRSKIVAVTSFFLYVFIEDFSQINITEIEEADFTPRKLIFSPTWIHRINTKWKDEYSKIHVNYSDKHLGYKAGLLFKVGGNLG